MRGPSDPKALGKFDLRAAETAMFREAREASDAVARMLDANSRRIARLQANSPPAIVTCARGSSDNAATYGAYLIGTVLGLFTASLGLFVSSIYGSTPKLPGGLCLAISQSGASPDLLQAVEQVRLDGARTVAMVNVEGSPLAAMADDVIQLSAGPEHSVAATKSCIASLAALAAAVAEWAGDNEFKAAVHELATKLDQAWDMDWGRDALCPERAHDQRA